ncbi:MAG: hypothetical protein A3B99_01775 [Candidatus Yanofskybacteria bacterium RIFCSPHIGHO2_02_FULL_44_12b]|uniref:TGS domain-containing protein n=2 Tax=Candidatus Yanofskyibacteriota TaxID=1752733 RepID=A0A1F8GN47_9BACT|nr:MAG: (P)ppGpp synthetase I (GTP pyrophosphokinase), SpoT/RelA [Candidatus Yanofskybacteria bacterium GW2011_GWA2_44_9]OGN05273.1 MAG: hypothetical protein A2659_04955 [Candidatus Yanofskybacteria bacterium RIFCSPHIGHO2_01_FULL_44_24]OGN14972.1 MAG: hypothetical protein A3B99_01775 [Candidatus Yanofskybacteria bacterium RIFCSPHIGHO2_02_FULL_44_12b]OGN26410.1 MAG: hypothetical protein A2925_03485 [Candidatus Yanofskybacteria bacterium RIFCSPLOWO2_01_FULL_44_22]
MTELLQQIISNPAYNDEGKALIGKAFDFAETAHRGQKRLSGEDYINHPLHAAYFLSELGLDAVTVAGALLHDTVEDTPLNSKLIQEQFGKEVAFLVDGVTKLGKIEYASRDGLNKKDMDYARHLSSLKKMFFAMAEDIRVILIKLADRYHNMETLRYQNKQDQQRIALETLEIYAPIAGRLGMGRLKGQLEDLAFPYVYPDEYSKFVKMVKDKYADTNKYIERTKPVIKKHLTDAGIEVLDMHSRSKHYFSLYQKLKNRNLELDKVFDLVAMRVIVPDIKSCYEALGVIHKYYKPFPGLIKDYIALPKPNGYQSLHTTIFCEKGRVVEIQIRTEDMHDHAENGIAAHWAYSEGGKKKVTIADKYEIQWISQLKKFLKETKLGESFTNLKIDFFKNRIFAFTPKGDVKDLPEGATPIDFAYAIHSDLGHSVTGAKVNGKMVPLEFGLKNGDVVEIIKGKNKKPSFDWLEFVKTTEAKRRIKSWFRENEVKNKSAEKDLPTRNKVKKKADYVEKVSIPGIPVIQGQRGLLYKIAKCCRPEVGSKIKGYMTINRGVSIHLATCKNIKDVAGKRIMSAGWAIKK